MTFERILFSVKKPGRYQGWELNSIHKDPGVPLRAVICYPDLYEVGMSNLGISIIYHRLNLEKDIWCERAFAPGLDLEEKLKEFGLPLFSLESRTPLKDFDLVGFSLQYELTFTQVLNMLQLGGIPLRAEERGKGDPVVVAGGPCTANPEPMAPFFDALLLGDGEDAALEIARTVLDYKKGKIRERSDLYLKLSQIEGVYVPALYKPLFSDSGLIKGWEIEGGRWPVKSRRVSDLDSAFFPTRPILPGIETVHDRAQVELFRGCVRGCRFCQAGFVYRPRRFKKPETVINQALEILKNTGWEELGLVSLSSCDYPWLEEVLSLLKPELDKRKVQVSLPSLRVDSFSVKIARLSMGSNITLTFAPEAGTQRMRDLIGKGISEEDIFQAVKFASESGFSKIKLYFMVGLPGETEADIEGIVDLVLKLNKLAKSGNPRARLSVSCSGFVPKPQTPFQWERMEELKELKRKRHYIRSRLEQRGIEVGGQMEELSFLEGVIARGDRRVAEVIQKAWEFGSRLDAWSDHFSFERWEKAFGACGIDPSFYLYRKRDKGESLPWEGAFYTSGKEYLFRERMKALNGHE
ncbi:MAG: TIGR03960 family B12-binding radical SAM protein [Caldiserica bacterium]|jgi:radical SAM family uncharacterized protein|nr:TIGR03960 family B12-binding radical SAM protein [Caldisericota bacterium]MDH7562489.1 TIGR03960 family B12-binding radical SAM protein [Caldisericota bacterium]